MINIQDWKMILDAMPDMICLLDRDYRITYMNKAMGDKLGRSHNIIGQFCYNVIQDKDAPQKDCPVSMLFADGGRRSAEIDNGPLGEYISVTVSPLHNGQGEIMGAIYMARDITELKRTQGELEKNEARYLDLLENANDLIQSVAPDGSFLYVNRAWLDTLGYTKDEVLRLNLLKDILAHECRDNCMNMFKLVLSGGKAEQIETTFLAKDGRKVMLEGNANCQCDEHGRPVFTRGIFRNITERKRLEKHIQRLQKIKSIGILAGGMAHEFNNILAGILGYTELCLAKVPHDSQLREFLLKIDMGGRRAAGLVGQLLAYSGQSYFASEQTSLADIMNKTMPLIKSAIPKNTQLKIDIAKKSAQIDADPYQIRHIIMAIITNAVEASGKGGAITIKAGSMYADRAYLSETYLNEGMVEGMYAYIEISDTGCGMDEDTLSKVFDPFFTTKFQGRGLGMAAVLGIVRGHKGTIKVTSKPGSGTTVRVLFPQKKTPQSQTGQDQGVAVQGSAV